MAETELAVEKREGTGKGAARKVRAAGKIPAILYGRGKPSIPLTVDPRELDRVLRTSEAGLNTLIDLQLGAHEEGKVVLVKEIQRDPVKGSMLHVDLFEIDLTQKVTVEVPVHLVGKAKGVEFGGVLDHTLREIEIECLPRAIPDAIEVDVSDLDVGDVVHVRDLAVPEGVEVLSDEDLAVALVSAPTVEEEPIAAEGELAEGEEVAPTEAGEAEGEKPKEEGGAE